MSMMIDSMRQEEKKLEVELQVAIRHLQLCPKMETEEARIKRNRVARELDILATRISQELKKEREAKARKFADKIERDQHGHSLVRNQGKTARNKAKPSYKDPKTKKAEKSERDRQIRRSMQSASGKKS